MKEQTGLTYESAPTSKGLYVDQAKSGKTTFLVAQALGVWPSQAGAIVDVPHHLHVIAADVAALKSVATFLTKHCGAPADSMRFRVYNLEEDIRRAYAAVEAWDMSLYNTVRNTIETVHERARKEGGVHVLHMSSLTGIAQAIKRGIQGQTGQLLKSGAFQKGSGMDMAKWDALGAQLAELRNYAQLDACHCIWEGHLEKRTEGKGDDEQEKDTIGVQGSVGKNFAMNVSEVFRIRRNIGAKVPGSATVDQMYLDTRPTLTFMANGRGFSELPDKVTDLASALHTLGYTVARAGKKVKVDATNKTQAPAPTKAAPKKSWEDE